MISNNQKISMNKKQLLGDKTNALIKFERTKKKINIKSKCQKFLRILTHQKRNMSNSEKQDSR